jgi:hypothetical protein
MYLIENRANKIYNFDDINKHESIIILCYHINSNAKYPFLQFMMEKIPYCNNLVKEQFILPYLDLNGYTNNDDLQFTIMNKIKKSLEQILDKSETEKISYDNYKGVVFNKEHAIILVNITNINVNNIELNRNSLIWFLLPSEIINNRMVCNIDVDIEAVKLFTKLPQLGLLFNTETNKYYILPDVAYTKETLVNSMFKSVFGNIKKKLYKCREYYYFYRNYNDALDQESVNRYAVFFEGKIFLEDKYEFSLKDRVIDTLYPESTIIICYTNKNHCNLEDLLIKYNDSFVSLSYHPFKLLGNS